MAIQDFEDWSTRVYWDYYFTILQDTPESYDGAAKKSVIVNDTETGLNYSNADVDDHSDRHEEGAADEITGITSKLNSHKLRHEEGGADELTEITGKLNNHSARHEDGGADELTEITGKLNNHSARHEDGGADEISVAGLSGELADAQTPKTHAPSHKDGGADELDAADLSGAAGTSGQVLKTDGAATSWGSVGGGTGYFGIIPSNVSNLVKATTISYVTMCEWQIYISSGFVLGVRVRAKMNTSDGTGYYRLDSPTAGTGGENSFADTGWAWRTEATLDCSGLSIGWHTFRLQGKISIYSEAENFDGMMIRMV